MKNKIKIENRKELIEKAYKLGFEYEKSSHYCAQCVVATLQNILQIKDESLFRASYPLSGGLGSTTQGTCGALSGGAMVLGYLYGRERHEFERGISNKKAALLSKRLYERFVQEYGSCICRNIQTRLFGRSFDFWNEDDKKLFEEAGGHKDKCPAVVGKACVWTLEIILSEEGDDSV